VTSELDLTKMEFPSDRLTVGAIRRMDAKVFATFRHGEHDYLGRLEFFQTLALEMDLAVLAFAKAAGAAPPDLGVSRDDIIEQLLIDYEKLGFGSGPASRQALIQKIESDAAAQARSAENGGISR
jgi:hypothetical protein